MTAVMAALHRARESWERAGRPGDYPQLRLFDGLGEQRDGRQPNRYGSPASVSCSPSCVVCDGRGCEFCVGVYE